MKRLLHRTELVLMGAGLVLVGLFAVAWLHRGVMSRASLRAFDRRVAAAGQPAVTSAQDPARGAGGGSPVHLGEVDFSLWSPKRIEGYRASLDAQLGAPLAVLRIPKLDLVVPVLDGTDELALNRGVGHIAGTARPGVAGNVGIAGHRDGFFRGLKDIVVGDRLDLVTVEGTESFQVEGITIVPPSDVSVLAATAQPTVTLVTCYPFYFVGSAPLRYIVRAVRVDGES
jgi:sortase A